jgi:hypothetical protein
MTRQKLNMGSQCKQNVDGTDQIIVWGDGLIRFVYVRFDICFENSGSVSAFREPYIASRRRLCACHIAIGFDAAVLAAQSKRMPDCLHSRSMQCNAIDTHIARESAVVVCKS